MRKNGLWRKALALALSISMIASSGVVAFADGDITSFEDSDVFVEQAVESADEALFEDASDEAGFSDEASFGFVEEENAWEDDGLNFENQDVYDAIGENETASEGIALLGDDVVTEESDVIEEQVNNEESALADNYVAYIGTAPYETLKAAFNAANDGDTIVVKKDELTGDGISIPEGKFNTKGLTVDFSNKTYRVTQNLVGSTGTERQAFQILKNNKITFKNGTIISSIARMIIQNYSDLTLDKMILTLDKTTHEKKPYYTLSNNNGNIIIKDSTINADESGGFAFDVCRYSDYPSVNILVSGNTTINGDVEVSASKSEVKDGFSLTLNSGTFNGKIIIDDSALTGIQTDPLKAYVKKADTYSLAPADGFDWFSNGDGTSSLGKAVAQIGTGETAKKYRSLAEAVAKVPDNGTVTITMIADSIELEKSIITAGKTITLDLNGKNIVGKDTLVGVMIENNGTLTIEGSGHVYTTYVGAPENHAIVNNGTITINEGTFGDADDDETNDNPYQCGNALYNYGTATINGGKFTAINFLYNNKSLWSYAISNDEGGKMTINDATAYGKTNGLVWDSGNLTIEGGDFTLSPSPTANYNYQVVGAGETATTYIKGGTFHHESVGGEAPYALRTLDTSKIYVSGGNFYYNAAIWGNWHYTETVCQVTGGTYDKNDVEDRVPQEPIDGKLYICRQIENSNRYEVVEDTTVVAIDNNNTPYRSLQAAVTAGANAQTTAESPFIITLTRDISNEEQVTIPNGLSNVTITGAYAIDESTTGKRKISNCKFVNQSSNCQVTGLTFDNLKLDNSNIVVADYGTSTYDKLTVQNCDFTMDKDHADHGIQFNIGNNVNVKNFKYNNNTAVADFGKENLRKSAIILNYSSESVEITNNQITGDWHNALQMNSTKESTTITITDNTFEALKDEGVLNLWNSHLGNATIKRNAIVNNNANPITTFGHADGYLPAGNVLDLSDNYFGSDAPRLYEKLNVTNIYKSPEDLESQTKSPVVAKIEETIKIDNNDLLFNTYYTTFAKAADESEGTKPIILLAPVTKDDYKMSVGEKLKVIVSDQNTFLPDFDDTQYKLVGTPEVGTTITYQLMPKEDGDLVIEDDSSSAVKLTEVVMDTETEKPHEKALEEAADTAVTELKETYSTAEYTFEKILEFTGSIVQDPSIPENTIVYELEPKLVIRVKDSAGTVVETADVKTVTGKDVDFKGIEFSFRLYLDSDKFKENDKVFIVHSKAMAGGLPEDETLYRLVVKDKDTGRLYVDVTTYSFSYFIASPGEWNEITVNFDSTQIKDVTLSYNSKTETISTSGESIRVPNRADVTVTANAVSGYTLNKFKVKTGSSETESELESGGTKTIYDETIITASAKRKSSGTSGSTTTYYTLQTSASTGGTVSPSGTNSYESGTSVSITATPSDGYEFSGWSGDATGTATTTSVTMTGNKSVTATFKKKETTGDKTQTFLDDVKALPDASKATSKDRTAVDKALKDYADVPATDKTKADVVAAKKTLDAVNDAVTADEVADKIEALPKNPTLADKDKVEAARKAYDALTADQKKLVPTADVTALENAEKAIKQAEADKTAADAADKLIKALPTNPTLDDKAQVDAAKKAYDDLTKAQKALIPEEDVTKLNNAVKAVSDAEAAKKEADAKAAKAVEDLIKSLPDPSKVTSKDKAAIEAVKKQYDALTPDQQALISADAKTKLQKDYDAIASADQKIAERFTQAVKAVPGAPAGTEKGLLDKATAIYAEMTEAQKALVADTTMSLYNDELAHFKRNYTFISGNAYYKVLSNGDVTYLKPTSRNITSASVPEEAVDGQYNYRVIKISNNAFRNCKKLKWVVVSRTVYVLGQYVFARTDKLETVKVMGINFKEGKVADAFFKAGKNRTLTVKAPEEKVNDYTTLFKGEGRLNGEVIAA